MIYVNKSSGGFQVCATACPGHLWTVESTLFFCLLFTLEMPTTTMSPASYFNSCHEGHRVKWKYSSPLPCLVVVHVCPGTHEQCPRPLFPMIPEHGTAVFTLINWTDLEVKRFQVRVQALQCENALSLRLDWHNRSWFLILICCLYL